MPSTYAHYYFGQLVLKQLPKDKQKIIQENRQLFDIGLHGPDIVFYHQPLKKNAICSSGYAMHDKSGKDFFEKALKIYQTQDDKQAHLSYLYGFVCHFALDMLCHPYVEQYIRDYNVSHTRIEVAFDRSLLLDNGFNPIAYHLSQHIYPSTKASQVISPYFELTEPKDIMKSLKSMNFYHKLLHAKNPIKRAILNVGMDIVGASGFKDQIMLSEDDPNCEKSNHDLKELLLEAVDNAVLLMDSFDQAINNAPLHRYFEHTFGEN